MMPALALLLTERLVHLSGVDLAIVAIYFALVLAIGFYLKRFANTSEDFFLAGREMTAWVAGLAFVSANLGSLELLGWAGNRLPVWHHGRALVLDRRNPRHGVSGYRDDALLLHFQNAFRAGLPSTALRTRSQCPQRHHLRFHDHSDVGREHVRHGSCDAGGVGLEHSLQSHYRL